MRLVAQLYLTLCDPMDCSPPGSSVLGILQARILEWVAMPSSRESSQPRDQTQVSCIAGDFFFFNHLSHQSKSELVTVRDEEIVLYPLGSYGWLEN